MRSILEQITLVEILGFLFSVAQVVLARYNNSKNYIFGIAGVILTLVVMYQAKLYAEFGLNLYYLVMSIFGWYNWKYSLKNKEISVSVTNKNEWIVVLFLLLISFSLSYFSLNQFTNSDVSFLDSLVTSFAWAGMWLMAKRKLENWILLNISNLIAIPLFIYKEVYLYAILSLILFIVAVSGYFNWKKMMNEND